MNEKNLKNTRYGEWIYLKVVNIDETEKKAHLASGDPFRKIVLPERAWPDGMRDGYEGWFIIENETSFRVRKRYSNDINYISQYEVGMICYGVINDVKQGQVYIYIGPGQYAIANLNYWKESCEEEIKLHKGMLCKVGIRKIQNRTVLCNIINVNDTIVYNGTFRKKHVNIQKQNDNDFLAKIYVNKEVMLDVPPDTCDRVARELGREITEETRAWLKKVIIEDFEIARMNRRIINDDLGRFAFEFRHRARSTEGTIGEAPIYVVFEKDKRKPNDKYACRTLFGGKKAKKIEEVFFEEIYVENQRGALDELADMALAEDWNYRGNHDNYILKSYLGFTYYVAKMQYKIAESKESAVWKRKIFDTGLVDKLYEPIYAVLVEVTSKDLSKNPNITQEFKLEGFTGIGRDLGKQIKADFESFPRRVEYIKDLSDIIVDTEKDIHWDIEHILLENTSRLPEHFFRQICHDSCSKEIDCAFGNGGKRDFAPLQEYLSGEKGRHILKMMTTLTEKAIEDAIKKAAWNYKTAIPIYYPAKNQLSIILPLELIPGRGVDVAIVLSKRGNGYQGETILTLDMAYLDSRLITRPESEWLNLDACRSKRI